MSKLIDIGDKTAVSLSVLCTFHCIASPLLLVVLPSVSGVLAFDPELLHMWLLFAVIPVSIFAMIAGYLHHRRASISFISTFGMGLLIIAVVFGHDLANGWGETILTIAGSIFIAYGHIKSLLLRRTAALSTI
jgi:carbon starvation protein CstA